MRREPPRCASCNALLLIDAPLNFLERWPRIRLEYGLNSVAIGGGWEGAGLDHAVPLDSPEAASCDAVYVGDVVTSDTVCPRCGHAIFDVLRE